MNHHEPVEDGDLAAKLAALEAHLSQMETTHFYRPGRRGDPLERFRVPPARARPARRGRPGRGGRPAAEAFHLIVDQL